MPIFIDSQKGAEYIPPYISVDSLKSIKGIPLNRKIIKISGYEGFKKVKKTETVDNEGIYMDVPEYKSDLTTRTDSSRTMECYLRVLTYNLMILYLLFKRAFC